MCASTGERMCACVLRMCAPRVFLKKFFLPPVFFFLKGGGTPSIPERGRGSAGAITVSEARAPRAPDPSPRGYFYLPNPGWICLLFTAEGCGRRRRRRPLTTTPPPHPPPLQPLHRLTSLSAAPGDSRASRPPPPPPSCRSSAAHRGSRESLERICSFSSHGYQFLMGRQSKHPGNLDPPPPPTPFLPFKLQSVTVKGPPYCNHSPYSQCNFQSDFLPGQQTHRK